MRSFGRLTVVGLVVSLFLALAPLAQADSDQDVSEPNGDISARGQSVASSDKDKDGNADTLTHSDNLHIFFSVFNLAEFAQTVRVSVVLDGPGTFQDLTLVDEDVDLGPHCTGGLCTDSRQGIFSLKVKRNKWPAGTYSLRVTGAGSETAIAVPTFAVAYEN
jgi:hypothetical protein